MFNVDDDQSFSRKTGQLDLNISTNFLPSSLTQGTLVANILNVRPGLTPAVGPSTYFTLGGSELSGWTVLVGPNAPTVPCTLRLTAGGQRRNFPLYLASGATPAPSFSVQPSISGTVQVGQTLTGADGTISNGTVSARQWYRDAGAISGATGTTYAPVVGDIGGFITFRITATGTGGVTSATSSAVGPVIAAADPGVGAPTAQPGVTSTLSVPGLTRTSGVLVTPPTLQGNFDVTYHQYDWVHLEMADDFAFTTHVGDFYAQLPATGDPTFTLGGYTPAAIGFARIRGLKAGVLTQSISAEDWTAYSTPVAWGDNVAPTITTSSTASIAENSVLAISLTANEGVASWAITGGADQVAFEISGTTLRWLGNIAMDYEVPTDSDLNNTYVVEVSATDYAGNVGTKTITVTVTDVLEFVPTIWNSSNKTALSAITGSGLVLTAASGGLWEGTSVTTSFSSGVREIGFSVDWNGHTGGGTNVLIGVILSSQNLTAGLVRPGIDNSTALAMFANNFPGNDLYQNGGYEGHSPSPFITGADNRLILDMNAKTVKIVINGVLQGFTVDISAWASGPVTFFALGNDTNIITINPTPTGLQSGSTAWGA